MHPLLFDLFGLEIYTYGAMIALAAISGVFLGIWRAKREGVNPIRIVDLALFALISGVVGAKLYLFFKEMGYYLRSLENFWSLVRSGGVIMGGLILAIAVSIWYIRRNKLDTWKMLDIAAPSIVLGQAIGRIGCFFAGCCYGKVCSGFPAVTFTDQLAHLKTGTPLHVLLHPTQLYHSAANFIIFGLLMFVYNRRKFKGQIFLFYIVFYSIGRFIIEFFRGDIARITIGGPLSDAQYLSIIGFVTALVFLVWKLRKLKGQED